MGNDGGSIPTRRELVKEAARNPTSTEIKQSQAESQTYAWTTDPVSLKPLSAPIVSDSAGKLYNKDTILEYLLPSTTDSFSRADATTLLSPTIKSLKDVVEVRFDSDDTHWKCPITNEPLGPGSKAVYLVPCGHAFSGPAIKEVAGENKCLVCNESYAANDVIPIAPVAATDIARLALRVKTLREKGLAHSLKKAAKDKKRKKQAVEEEEEKEAPVLVSTATTTTTTTTTTTIKRNGDDSETISHTSTTLKPATIPTPALTINNNNNSNTTNSRNIKNASTASLTARVMQEQEATKRRKTENSNLKSLFTSRDPKKPSGRSSDFMTRGFEIPANAKR